MPKGIRRCLALTILAVAGLFFAGCSSAQSSTAASDKNYGRALLYVDKNLLGTKRVYAYPDPIVITGYDKNPDQVVTWSYIHKSTNITFKEPKIGNNVECKEGTCTLKLPRGLMDGVPQSQTKRNLKYTITGEDDQGKLHPNDPDVEIDR